MSIEDDYNKLASMYAAAKAEVTLLGKELSTCHVYAKQIRESRDAEIARLWEALAKYADHQRTCASIDPLYGPISKCNCGFAAVHDQIGDQGEKNHES